MSRRLPTQANCDPDDPVEHLLWTLVNVPYTSRQPITFPMALMRAIAEHQHACGARHNPELQTRKLQVPYRGQQHVLNSSSIWVPMDAEEPDPVVIPDMSAHTVHEREHVVQQLRELGHFNRIEDVPADRDIAKVSSMRDVAAAARAARPARTIKTTQGAVGTTWRELLAHAEAEAKAMKEGK
jgi:hypothetical protein